MKSIYNLKLHEYSDIDSHPRIEVFRVPGGWVYLFRNGSVIFVPYDNEFQEVAK